MKIGKLKLNLNEGIKKEWLISNGIGGFCSSTVIGANTRRYHGLLIASLNPPATRYLVLSKLDEGVVINDRNYNLFTNICKDYISDGYKSLVEFEKEYYPKFKYEVEDVKIEKRICMVYGQNATVVSYKIKTGKNGIKLVLAPVINFRGFHSLTPNKEFSLYQEVNNTNVKVNLDSYNWLYMHLNKGAYMPFENETFRNMYYIKEEERGFDAEENLGVSGKYEVEIPANTSEEINFVVSLNNEMNSIDVENVFKSEEKRLENIVENSKLIKKGTKNTRQDKEKNQVIKDLIISGDSFIVDRPRFNTKSIIAGYPWFLDWGRDTFIAFEGLLLVTKRFDDAKNVIKTFIRDVNSGLIPNGYSEDDDKPLYNSADSALLLFEVVNKYLEYTEDYDFINKSVYSVLVDIIQNYSEGITLDGNNIFLDSDGLISSGTENIQNTWMDAKIGDYVVTPRNGKVVEINSLWYNALKTLEKLAKEAEDDETLKKCRLLARKAKKSFAEKFYNSKKKCLFDVIGDDKIRPNQLFSLSLTYPILDPKSEEAKNMFNTCTNKLLLTHGLRTLARGEDKYVADYAGDAYQRDMSYHQGPSWPWLLGLYSNAFEKIIKSEKDEKQKSKLKKEFDDFVYDIFVTYKKEIYSEDGVGTISEVYNSKLPYKAGGTFSQAWSVSEVLKIILKRNLKND